MSPSTSKAARTGRTGRFRNHARKVAWHRMTPDKAFWLLAAFVVLVFLMGGGSRYDIDSVGPLRALSAIFLAIGVYYQTDQSFRAVRMPVALILVLGLWMVVQMVPLPPSIWTSLHGRETIAQAGALIGLQDIWRPITFSPLRTANSLASLVVPLAGLMLVALLDENGWRRTRMIIIVAGLASALLGIAQLTLRGSPGLYLYEITNSTNAVGLFSNRNHNALFLNIALLVWIFQDHRPQSFWAPASLLKVAGQLILLLAILINGSRFGFALLAVVGLIFAVRSVLAARADTTGSRAGRGRKRRIIAAVIAAIAATGLIVFFAALDQIPALSRLFEQDVAQDLRARSFPEVVQMAIGHFPFGVGFGAFELAYRNIEPDALLDRAYLNQAHNDWLQIVVTGGLPGVLIVFLGLFLVLKRVWTIWRSRRDSTADLSMPVLGFLMLFVFGLHSVVDYPLRVPSLMVVATIALGMLFSPLGSVRKV